MKLTKGKIIAAVAVIAVLAGAFWYGGNAPGLQGWTVQEQESSAVLEAAPPASGPEESICLLYTSITIIPTADSSSISSVSVELPAGAAQTLSLIHI